MSVIVVAIMVGLAEAADWPQFLGPERNSTSTETGLLRSWPDDGPEVLWTANVGEGLGGPVAVSVIARQG
ncbi:MAG: hypothetical protein KDB27_21530 [Planctomycetales bacterium]|nr:hypothetical protein [Planctomycetales bacterium]